MKIRYIARLLPLALAAFVASPAAHADLPKANQANDIRQMDTNKNGKVEREEYIAFMTASFDKAAGSKGYCTFEEVQSGFVKWINNP